MQGIRCKMPDCVYETDHGYRKEMAKENVPCVFISCQFTSREYSQHLTSVLIVLESALQTEGWGIFP